MQLQLEVAARCDPLWPQELEVNLLELTTVAQT